MNALRKAVREYLELRRSLGFKLREAGRGLIDFVTFMEGHKALTLLATWRLPGLKNL